MNVWKIHPVMPALTFVSIMRAATNASSVTNLALDVAETDQICAKNVLKDMSYATECVLVSKNFFLFFTLTIFFCIAHFLSFHFVCVFRLKDLFSILLLFDCYLKILLWLTLLSLSPFFLLSFSLSNRSYKRKTRSLREFHTLLFILWSLRDCVHYFPKFNVVGSCFWCHCCTLHLLFGILA
jgi:hypothetical protein